MVHGGPDERNPHRGRDAVFEIVHLDRDMPLVMVEGEDHSVWCEKNNLTREQAYECGGTIYTMYENANWWLEPEVALNTFQDDPYGDYNDI